MLKKLNESLENRSLLASESKALLETLKQNQPQAFIAFDDENGIFEELIPQSEDHRWTEAYYDALLSDLSRDKASYERYQHIVEVKALLQRKGVKGFVAQQSANQAVVFKEEIAKETEKETAYTQEKSLEDSIMSVDVHQLLSGFTPEKKYLDALNNKDIEKLRLHLLADLNSTKINVETVLKTGLYLEQKCQGLFEEYGISPFYQEIENKEAKWDADYFSIQQVYLNKNFARERFLHLINVSEHLGKQGVKGFVKNVTAEPKKVEVQREERSRTDATQREQRSSENRRTTSTFSSSQQTSQNTRKTEYASERREQPTQSSDDNLLKKVLLIGGAVLGAVIALISILK